VIAEPLSLENRPQVESAAALSSAMTDQARRPNSEPDADPSRPAEGSSLTMAGVTSSLQLILAARRAARVADNIASR
jgi:hypothetical protein